MNVQFRIVPGMYKSSINIIYSFYPFHYSSTPKPTTPGVCPTVLNLNSYLLMNILSLFSFIKIRLQATTDF